ncbi:MAG: RNA-guided pseudouridylation complex pseudouridine synthase subunit Cbf5 [Candidatus Aenigmarchaeota archaeon]|nr:RNA-guided pseudouridylation complex pseudouridine synthase subunit Cbf5 [Candidatus Aenigmarchaeota archaeon]
MSGMVKLAECEERTQKERSIGELLQNGMIILDKWTGPTSRDVVGILKKILELKKAGHPGTLDPPATGVLPVMLENATKVMPALQGLDKEYVAVMHMHRDFDEDEIKKKLAEFVGVIKQKPPLRSAVARVVRERRVYEANLLQKEGRNICVRIKCQAGTYIRLIAHDLGKKLGSGAHLKELRRTAAGPFTEQDAVKIQDVQDAYEKYKKGNIDAIKKIIRPVEDAVMHVKKVIIKDSAITNVKNGSPLFTSGLCSVSSNVRKGNMIAMMSLDGFLIALGIAKMDLIEMKKRGVAVKTDRVM